MGGTGGRDEGRLGKLEICFCVIGWMGLMKLLFESSNGGIGVGLGFGRGCEAAPDAPPRASGGAWGMMGRV